MTKARIAWIIPTGFRGHGEYQEYEAAKSDLLDSRDKYRNRSGFIHWLESEDEYQGRESEEEEYA